MALTTTQKKRIEAAIGHRADAAAISAAIDSNGSGPAAAVAALGTTTALVGVDGTGDNAAPLVGTEARLDAIEAKIDAVIASLKAAGMMANS